MADGETAATTALVPLDALVVLKDWMSDDPSRTSIHGVRVETAPEGSLLLVATDGHALLVLEEPMGDSWSVPPGGCFIPGDRILELIRAVKPSKHVRPVATVTTEYLEHDQVKVSLTALGMTSSEGASSAVTFPDYRQVIPAREDESLHRPCFNVDPVLLARLQKVVRFGYDHKGPFGARLQPNTDDMGPIRFDCETGYGRAFGAIMTMRL